MGIKLIKNNGYKFWEILGGIIGRTKSIIGSGLEILLCMYIPLCDQSLTADENFWC